MSSGDAVAPAGPAETGDTYSNSGIMLRDYAGACYRLIRANIAQSHTGWPCGLPSIVAAHTFMPDAWDACDV